MFRKFLLSLPIVLLIFLHSANAEVTQIDNKILKQLISEGVPLVDVRTVSEWQETGIIEGSHLLTFFDEQGKYDINEWLKQLQQVASPEQPVIFICAVGGRTQPITHFLDAKLGYQKVYNVTAGIKAWIAANNVTVPPSPLQHKDKSN